MRGAHHAAPARHHVIPVDGHHRRIPLRGDLSELPDAVVADLETFLVAFAFGLAALECLYILWVGEARRGYGEPAALVALIIQCLLRLGPPKPVGFHTEKFLDFDQNRVRFAGSLSDLFV